MKISNSVITIMLLLIPSAIFAQEKVKDNREVFSVSTAEEFIRSLGSNRIIKMKPGKYNLDVLKKEPGIDRDKNVNFNDGNVVLKSVKNLKIVSDNNKNRPEIFGTSSRLIFEKCENIELDTIYIKESGVMIEECKNVMIINCDFSGKGLDIYDTQNFQIKNSAIRDCKSHAIFIVRCSNIIFKDTLFAQIERGNRRGGDREVIMMGNVSNCLFKQCQFKENNTEYLIHISRSVVKFENTVLKENNFEDFYQLGKQSFLYRKNNLMYFINPYDNKIGKPLIQFLINEMADPKLKTQAKRTLIGVIEGSYINNPKLKEKISKIVEFPNKEVKKEIEALLLAEYYKIQKGDTLAQIALKHDVSVAFLLALNPSKTSSPDYIVSDRMLRVPGDKIRKLIREDAPKHKKLIEKLNHKLSKERAAAFRKLVELDWKVIPLLLNALKSDILEVKVSAREALQLIHKKKKPAQINHIFGKLLKKPDILGAGSTGS